MKTKLLIPILLILLILPMIRADIFYKANTNLSIKIPCTNLGNPCDNNTLCNITIVNNQDTSYVANNNKTDFLKNGDFQYNVTFSTLGQHTIKLFCSDGISNQTAVFNARVTQSGQEGTLIEAVGYTVFMLILLALLILCLVGSTSIESENTYDFGGNLIKITYGKYFKMILFFFSYMIFEIMSFLGWQMADTFLTFPLFSNILKWLFYVLLALTFPLLLFTVVLVFTKALLDAKLWEYKERGVKPR